jgi:hypothetical protein
MSDQFNRITNMTHDLQSEIYELSSLSIGDGAAELLGQAIAKLDEVAKLVSDAESVAN